MSQQTFHQHHVLKRWNQKVQEFVSHFLCLIDIQTFLRPPILSLDVIRVPPPQKKIYVRIFPLSVHVICCIINVQISYISHRRASEIDAGGRGR